LRDDELRTVPDRAGYPPGAVFLFLGGAVAREIVVGNGMLLVGFDRDYCLRDLYFPSVGKENQTDGRRCRFGVWADGRFSWVDRTWELAFDYVEDSLVSRVRAANPELGVELDCNDLVDSVENMYIRRLLVRNRADREREIRVFFHHDFNILESPAANTAYYDPDEKALVHYREKRYFLMSGMRGGVQGIDQYATGVKGFHGFEGTWRDAEDGVLEGNPIAQGSVDSVLSFSVLVPPGGGRKIEYWICAGQDYSAVSRLNKMIQGHGLEHFTRRTDNYWKAWANNSPDAPDDLSPSLRRLYKRSLLILQTNIDRGGAVIAGTDSDIAHAFAPDTYAYMWPRDGALTAFALDRVGYQGIGRKFFDFCYGIIRTGKESLGGYFLHKYNPDGSLGSSWHPWVSGGQKILPIQEDGTALVLWALWKHFEKYRDIEFVTPMYEQLILRCGDFLASYRDDATGLPLPSYDLWEEQWGVHTYTAAAVYAGIRAAECFTEFFRDSKRKRIYGRAADELRGAVGRYLYSREHGRFLKTVVPRDDGTFTRDLRVDASTYAPFYFGVFTADDERVVNTMRAVRDRLWVRTPVGGVARYEGDGYLLDPRHAGRVPGNPWFICTLWLAQWHIARGELDEAGRMLAWAGERAAPSGVLAEQIDPFTGEQRSVAPLTWSQATLVSAVQEYRDKLRSLQPKEENIYVQSR
jgi:GH15 family glucan-1,4-alpha-glucosidase